MEKLGFGHDEESTTCDQEKTDSLESCLMSIRHLSIHCCIEGIIHAGQCRDGNCQFPSCLQMKRLFLHARSCTRRISRCPGCKYLVALCMHHGKNCQEAECPASFCKIIKYRIKYKQQMSLSEQAQNLIRAMAARCGMSCAVLQTSQGISNSSSQQSPGAQTHSSLYPQQPGIGMKPTTGPPVGALEAVQQVQAAAARQIAPHMVAVSVKDGKRNLVVSPPTIFRHQFLSSQPSPGAQTHSSLYPQQPGIGMKPTTGPPIGALEAVQQVQAAAARQTAPHMVAVSVVVSPPTIFGHEIFSRICGFPLSKSLIKSYF